MQKEDFNLKKEDIPSFENDVGLVLKPENASKIFF